MAKEELSANPGPQRVEPEGGPGPLNDPHGNERGRTIVQTDPVADLVYADGTYKDADEDK